MRNSLQFIYQVLSRIGIALLLYFISRLLFFLFNYTYFPDARFTDFFIGFRYDLSAIAYLYSPFIFLSLLGFTLQNRAWFRKILKTLFFLPTIISLMLNCIDFEYFKFTHKRTTSDLLGLMSESSTDLISLVLPFLRDYWYVILTFFILLYGMVWLYQKTEKKYNIRFRPLSQVPAVVILLLLWLVAMRGGVQLKPITIINAGEDVKAQNIPLVLNTPFTFLKTIFEPGVKKHKFYESKEALQRHFNPEFRHLPKRGHLKNDNVVLIVMESFSAEYVGSLNPDHKGYTPFLDSLITHSMVYENAFANGKKSIEALPAILSGIPALMNTPFIISPYASNKIGSIATALGEKGYNSSFYHGGANGTMGFSGFAKVAGIDKYHGKNEYPHKGDDDGTWGIFDEPYFQYFAGELDNKPQPFFSSIFSLSSHHPYRIPEKYKDIFPKGKHPLHKSIGYADYSLKKFFETASKSDWYENTLFIITADHTAQAYHPYYKNRVGMYNIPLIFFHPSDDKLRGRNKRITQQADIYPSILSYLNYDTPIITYGSNCFSHASKGFSVNYLNGVYQLIQKEYVLQFDGSESIGLFNFKTDIKLKRDLLKNKPELALQMENKLKAIIQSFEMRLLKNELTIAKEKKGD